MLKNKAGLWKSVDSWIFKTKDDDVIYIENTSKTKVWAIKNDTEVILEDFEENNAKQVWKKGDLDAEGYFSLKNSKVPKLITAISSRLKIKGNIILQWIPV